MKKRIGDILVEIGVIDADQLKMALMEGKKTGVLLGEVLQKLDWVTEEQLQMAIAVQSGAKILDLESVSVDLGLLAEIPQDLIDTHNLFPIEVENGILKAATTNPFDVVARDKLSRLTGFPVEAYLAPKDWISKSIEVHYKTALTIDNSIEQLAGITDQNVAEDQIIKLANLLIEKGYVLGASDIHVIPDSRVARVYYRIDGVLHQNYLFTKSIHQNLAARFKIMSDIDISNPNIPHDGRINYHGSVDEFDLRVSTMPTQFGETVVMRLLVYNQVVGDLVKLGLDKEDLEVFMKNIQRPYGLILSTGPTGSGKTTTLYSALMQINSPSINTMTIEDPIEYVIPSVRQTAVNPKAGLSFGNALRSAMRQDPDVILVGEIRDKETADLAIRASITGHLVLSTLHTNDAASAINRLLDLGVNRNNLASSLTMVVAQRLLRRVCKFCATVTEPSKDHEKIFKKVGLAFPEKVMKANGCGSCFQSGYKGRIGIFEIIQINRDIEELIYRDALHSMIEDAAVKGGTNLLFNQAMKHVVSMQTTIEEVFRVVADA